MRRATIVVSPGGSIQAAVNFAGPGDTILVNPGTYREQVTIGKSLTLRANGAGVHIQAPTTMTPDALGLHAIVEVNSGATVIVGGFTLEGPDPEINVGALVVGGATLNLDGNTITGINQGPATFDVQTGVAVQAGSQAPAQVGHLTATGNTVEHYQKAR